MAQISNIKSEKREVTADSTERQRTITDYQEEQYANKVGNLEEVDKLLEMYTFPTLNQGETENTNRPITTYLLLAMLCSL